MLSFLIFFSLLVLWRWLNLYSSLGFHFYKEPLLVFFGVLLKQSCRGGHVCLSEVAYVGFWGLKKIIIIKKQKLFQPHVKLMKRKSLASAVGHRWCVHVKEIYVIRQGGGKDVMVCDGGGRDQCQRFQRHLNTPVKVHDERVTTSACWPKPGSSGDVIGRSGGGGGVTWSEQMTSTG